MFARHVREVVFLARRFALTIKLFIGVAQLRVAVNSTNVVLRFLVNDKPNAPDFLAAYEALALRDDSFCSVLRISPQVLW